jgi:hypothetical protein
MSETPGVVSTASPVDSPPDENEAAEYDAPERPTPVEIVDALLRHPQGEALAGFVRGAALEAAAARRPDFGSRFQGQTPHAVPKLPDGLTRSDADTAYGNVVDVLERGVQEPLEADLLGALLALSARAEPDSEDEERAFVTHLVWLATHTPVNALPGLDGATPEREAVFRALAVAAAEPTRAAADFGRAEALVAAAALGVSSAPAAPVGRAEALAKSEDLSVRALLLAGAADLAPLHGELVFPPLAPLATAVLAFSLLLFIWQGLRLVARFVFAYRRPAVLRITPRGLELTHQVMLLGKVLRDRATLVPLANLSRVTRETRYARLGLYAGLVALVLGTYFGMGLFVDGLRVPGGSGALLEMAAAMMIAGLAIDFVLSSIADSSRGKCRLLLEPRLGRKLCVSGVDPASADAMLAGLATGTS